MSECLHPSRQWIGDDTKRIQICNDCTMVLQHWPLPPLLISGTSSHGHTYRHKHGDVTVTVWESDGSDGAFVVQIDTTFDRPAEQLRVNVGEGTVWGREHGSPEKWLLEGTSCVEGTEEYRRLTEHVPQAEMLAALANDLVAVRRLDLPDPEPVGYGGDDYWTRAKELDHG